MPQSEKIPLRQFHTANTRAMRILLLVGIVWCFPSAAAAQRERPTGQSIITGRVLFADTGRPVRRATVTLHTNLQYPPVRVTPANQRGEFRFTGVAAGSYFVVARASGIVYPLSSFAITEFGLTGSGVEAEQTRVTVDGKNTSRCEVRAPRAGSIKGVMIYSDKEPVVNGRIVLFRRKNGGIAPFFSDSVITNDRGMYRIDGLPDGEYLVGLMLGKGAAEVTGPRPRNGIAAAYYPGVTSIREAKPILIESGTAASGINITLDDDDNLRKISGVVKWRHSDVPVSGAVLTLRRKEEPKVDVSLMSLFRSITPEDADNDDTMMRDMGIMMMALPATFDVDDTGEWRVEDLPPGTYIISAYAPLPKTRAPAKTDAQPGSEAPESFDGTRSMVSKEIEITVDEEDRKDITIELSEGGRILGFVTAEDGSPAPPVAITIEQQARSGFILDLPHLSTKEGTFLLEGVPAGQVQLDVGIAKPGMYLKSITHGGQDLMREPLRIAEGAEITNVRITLGSETAKLSGRVQVKEDGLSAAGAGVLLVKSDPKLWHLHSSRVFATADANGAFTMMCAPGDYVVITWPAGGQPLQDVEGFVRAQGPTARRISLQSKDDKQIELTLAGPRK